MSVLKSIFLKLATHGRVLSRHILCVLGRAYGTLPILLVVLAGACTGIAAVVAILMVTHADKLESLVGIGTTITVLTGSIGLLVSSIGVLIAALRYVSERQAVSKPHDQIKQTSDRNSD
jgi:hypothetical protein